MPLIVPSFAMPSRLLGTPTVVNQMRFGGNYFFGEKFVSIIESVLAISKTASFLLLEYFYKYIHNLEMKMFFQNSGNNFTLYCLIYAWLKFYVNIMRFSKAATQRGSLVKVFWKCAANLQETTHAEVWFQESCKAILMKPHLGMDVLL